MTSIALFEEHGEVLPYWVERGYRAQTLICFDRHLDLKRISDRSMAALSACSQDAAAVRKLYRTEPFAGRETGAYGLDDFVYPALRLGLLRRFILVMPEPSPIARQELAKLLWDHVVEIPMHGSEIVEHFRVHESGASTSIAGAEIVLTTARRLSGLGGLRDARVDFDLDYFADESGRVEHEPAQAAEILTDCRLATHVETATHSISSGFLPESLRGLGEHLASCLASSVYRQSDLHGAQLASTRLLARNGRVRREEVEQARRAELESRGATGRAVLAALFLRAGLTHEAVGAYWEATAMGTTAHWVAYRIGLWHLQRRHYADAASWFSRGYGTEICDRVELKSAILERLSLLRLGAADGALAGLAAIAEAFPLCADLHRIGLAAAAKVGDAVSEQRHRGALDEIEQAIARWR